MGSIDIITRIRNVRNQPSSPNEEEGVDKESKTPDNIPDELEGDRKCDTESNFLCELAFKYLTSAI